MVWINQREGPMALSYDRFNSSFQHDCRDIKHEYLSTVTRRAPGVMLHHEDHSTAAQLIAIRAEREFSVRCQKQLAQRQAQAKQIAIAALAATESAAAAKELIQRALAESGRRRSYSVYIPQKDKDSDLTLEPKQSDLRKLLADEAITALDHVKLEHASPTPSTTTGAPTPDRTTPTREHIGKALKRFEDSAVIQGEKIEAAHTARQQLKSSPSASNIDPTIAAIDDLGPAAGPWQPRLMRALSDRTISPSEQATLRKALSTKLDRSKADPIEPRITALQTIENPDLITRAAHALCKHAKNLLQVDGDPDQESDDYGFAKAIEPTELSKILEKNGADKIAIQHAQRFDNATRQLHDAHTELAKILKQRPDLLSGNDMGSADDNAAYTARAHKAILAYQMAQTSLNKHTKALCSHGGCDVANSLNSIAYAVFTAQPNGTVHKALKAGLAHDPKALEGFTEALRKRQSLNQSLSSGYTVDPKAGGISLILDRIRSWYHSTPTGAYKALPDKCKTTDRESMFTRYKAQVDKDGKRTNMLELGELERAGVTITLDETSLHWELGIRKDRLKQQRTDYKAWCKTYEANWKAGKAERNIQRVREGKPIDTRKSLSKTDLENAYVYEKGLLAPPNDKRIKSILAVHQRKFYQYCKSELAAASKESKDSLKAHRDTTKAPKSGTSTGVDLDGPSHSSSKTEDRGGRGLPRAIDPKARGRRSVRALDLAEHNSSAKSSDTEPKSTTATAGLRS